MDNPNKFRFFTWFAVLILVMTYGGILVRGFL